MKSGILITTFLCLLCFTTLKAQSTWPQRLVSKDGQKITIYQPQTEDLTGNILTGRAALSVTPTSTSDPVFGIFWFKANLAPESGNNKIADLNSIEVTQIKLPDTNHLFQNNEITQLLQNEMPKKNIQFDVAEISSSAKQEQKSMNPVLNNNAPNIIYRNKPSTWVVIDGEPKFEQDSKLNIEKMVNTPSLIVKSPEDNLLYFYGGGIWYSASDINSKWSFVKYLPAQIQRVDDLIHQDAKAAEKGNDNDINKATTPSEIIVSTTPAELIQTEGDVSYQSITETNLLYADNSLDDIFKDVNTQRNYILLSGRWYSAPSLNGPWTFVPSNQLPADFAKIPEGSEKDGVLPSVAGTSEANDAIMNAQVPQTAKIDRRTATCNVTYDGAPSFNHIDGTSLMVAENSNITVLKSHHRYFAVDNGVWFTSNSAVGPWSVSTQRPDDVDNIPADNIAYNTRYVNVYDYDDNYVWDGYTPGYTGCYIYGPSVVWGTGYYYQPWYHNRYYARPYTWGFGMRYDPWIGWGFSYNMWPSLGWGFYGDGFYGGYYGGYYGGWFGPRYYRPGFNSWGYHGGYYGHGREGGIHGGGYGYGGGYAGGGIFLRKPNVNFNRPSNLGNGINGMPHRNGSNIAMNGGMNLYHRVPGAQTSNVTMQPHNGTAGSIFGRPGSNATVNNNLKPNPNTNQQHFNTQGNTYQNINQRPNTINNNHSQQNVQPRNNGNEGRPQQSYSRPQQQQSHNYVPQQRSAPQQRSSSPSRGNSSGYGGSSHSSGGGRSSGGGGGRRG